MSLYSMLKAKGPNGFGYGSTAEDVTAGLSLAGKTFLVTGCNSGLGLETARVLALRGGRIFGTARTTEKATTALAPLGGNTLGFECELSDPASVRGSVKAVVSALKGSKIDALICNAGIMALPELKQAFGLELQFFTNHIGHFLLVTGLLNQLALADEGRVVMLSSAAHKQAPKGGIEFDNLAGERDYAAWKAYGQSKMANLLFAKELARRFEGTKKTANSVHPGVIFTNLSRHMNPLVRFAFGLGERLLLKSAGEGSATTCYVAVHPGAAAISGKFFADCNVTEPRADGSDAETAKKLWAASEEIVARLP
ncbi:MAG: SDR family oxidoreductase [Vicinamibacteria bacterium]|nr:SDR family oxidoreductase [Vicinamibacteria bacterium]